VLGIAGEESVPSQYRMRLAQANHRGRKGQQVLLVGVEIPVDPRDLAVLGVDVVIAVLGSAQLITVRQHRNALTHHHRGNEVPLLPQPQRVDRGIVGVALYAAVP
jgi:hypothetical protein